MKSPLRLSGCQRGIATLWAVIFIIVGVTITLTQVLDIAGSRGRSTVQQSDSTAALFVAESGLEHAYGTLRKAIVSGGTVLTDSSCTGITGTSIGGGSFSYGTLVSTPASCSGAACTGCSVTVTGTQGSAKRTVSRAFRFDSTNKGTSGCGTSVQLTVKNPALVPATAVFNMAWRRQMSTGDYPSGCPSGAGGSATASSCGTACGTQWNLESSSGNPSVGSIGTTWAIAAGSLNTPILQTISTNRDYAEVAGLFPGVAGSTVAPPVTGGFWGHGSGRTPVTVVTASGNNDATYCTGGKVNTGETYSGVSPSTASSSPITDDTQTSMNWCWGADTLVFAASGKSASYTDTFCAVRFDTDSAATPVQDVPLVNVAHFPNTDGTFAFTSGDVFGEIWYAYNPKLSNTYVTAGNFVTGRTYKIATTGLSPNFTGAGAANNNVGTMFVATGVGSGTGTAEVIQASASSYKGSGTGAIGATVTGYVNGNELLVKTITTGTSITPAGTYSTVVYSGDTLKAQAGLSATTITGTATVSGPEAAQGVILKYTLSSSQNFGSNGQTKTIDVLSNILNVTSCTICFFANGDALSGLISARTIDTVQLSGTPGGIGKYHISGTAPTSPVISAATLRAGTPGTTIYQPSTEPKPAVTTPATRIAIYSGTGALSANTTVVNPVGLANPATTFFTVSSLAVPTVPTPLDNATICAGTCAFFNNPSSSATSNKTQFKVWKTGGVDQWGAGFTCLSGVDSTAITAVTDISSITATTWSEKITP